ncbi:hypothetical protein GGI13_006794 [Coemansia sp. RSA 455]|nr:hypothetical protein GGI14_000876 [Coemansia sp. S680]KAJ2068119.1 hypothetical protein GGI08_001040 [Coemansia sp. S2]KAJ2072936.1 hypothetical protein GGH13_002345 [Coemansia sp. S155-1]KAJ2103620.1 hypothetical protein GGI09_000560 [Coemansia sp. S100]KAJ2106233.1 hypothetical protein GGI16_002007 [Coemansia sp. S142-1]KAJ2242892.1 hypothetical protein GGI13_006794 [Coemansia sp. RSA 455]KAJ2343371.1 hypothetical protein GGH92_004947 [Coemansia sp. RSA 2673]KAJ2461912.1 hypothetical pr
MSPIAVDFASVSSPLSAPSTSARDLLLRSPVYTDDCDLYPRRMREVMNQQSRVIVVPEEDSGAALHSRQQAAALARRHMTAEDIEALLKLYPGAARHLQI